jgi:hypothetical protein
MEQEQFEQLRVWANDRRTRPLNPDKSSSQPKETLGGKAVNPEIMQETTRISRRDDRDPTANVLLILNSEIKGLTSLVEAYKSSATELTEKRFERIDERFKAHLEHAKEISTSIAKEFSTHIATSREMNENERKRLDALIASIIQTAVDVNTQTVATAATLQVTVASTAEAARIKLEATELALRTGNAQSTETLARTITAQNEDNAKRFKALEDARAEGVGKSSLSTPLLVAIGIGGGGILMKFIDMLFK